MADLPAVSVVIPSHHRRDLLSGAVTAALADPATAEVVAVVNGSTDGSLEAVRRLARSDDRVRPLAIERRPLGPARAAGVQVAGGEVVLFLDDDVRPQPGVIAGHARYHARRDRLVVMGWIPVAPTCLQAGGIPARLFSEWYEAQVPRWGADPATVLRGLWGGHVSLRREHALAVPPHDPSFTGPTNQDRDWGLRLLKAGLEGRFDPALRADHLYRRSVAAFIRVHGRSGAGTWLVHHLHADVIGPLPRDHYYAHLPSRRRPLVRFAGRRRAAPLVRAAALAARLVPTEATIVLALTMAQHRNAVAASRGR